MARDLIVKWAVVFLAREIDKVIPLGAVVPVLLSVGLILRTDYDSHGLSFSLCWQQDGEAGPIIQTFGPYVISGRLANFP